MSAERRSFTVKPAPICGFVITEGDELVAAFSTGAEACAWIERQYRPLEADPEEVLPPMPRIVSSSHDSAPEAAATSRRSGVVHRLLGG